MNKSCLGCDAYEFPMTVHRSGHCALGYKTEKIETVAGFYGKDKQLIGCRAKPLQPCPKPRTIKKFLELWRIKNND